MKDQHHVWTDNSEIRQQIEGRARDMHTRARAIRLTIAILVIGAATISFSMGWGIHSLIHKADHAGEIGKAKAYDSHCNLMRFTVDGMRRDLWRGRSPEAVMLQYRDLSMHDFENANVCMLTEIGDPMFFPQPCFADDPAEFKSCVLNQLDMLLLVMR